MPGTSNPVSGNPVSGVSHSKSFRTRLGFGGSSTGGSSVKPSFFSQLNLKSGRKSFGGPTDFHVHDRPVLVIDREPNDGRMRQENRVVLNDELEPGRAEKNPMKPHSDSPSKEHVSCSRQNLSHSLPASPIDTHIPSYSLNSRTDLDMFPVRGTSSETRVDPNESGLSKHLPDLSTDLSLLLDEPPPPDTASQSDHNQGSQASVLNISSSKLLLHHAVASVHAPFPGSSPATLETHQQNQRWDLQGLAGNEHNLRSVVSSPPGLRPNGLEPSGNAISPLTDAAVENASASFDLSSARFSLDLMRHSLGEDWARSVLVESNSAPSADTSALLVPPEPSMEGSGSGPVTSTPFLSPSASPSQSQRKEPEISFDLDALDPDLVALLRPNNYNQAQPHVNRIVTPSPLEPFAPPPDPLNPGTTVKRLVSPTASPSSSRAVDKPEGSTPSPVRKYATMSASGSSSPVRQPRLPRSYTAKDIFPPSHAPKPAPGPATLDLPWLETRGQDDGRPSPSSAVTSELGTPSDASKQPSPLSAPPLTLDDLQRKPGPIPLQSSHTLASNSNITTRRKARTAMPGQIQSPVPVSVLTSSTDSRPTPRYAPRSRDRDFRPASASPEMPSPYTHTFGSTGRERERVRPPIQGLFSLQHSPEGGAGRPSSADAGRPGGAFRPRLNSNNVLPHPRDREWETSVERRYRKRSMSLDQSPAGFEGRGEDFYIPGGMSSRFPRTGDRERLAEPAGHGGSEYAYSMNGALGAPYDGRDPDRDRERYGYGYGYGDRERLGRPHTDWLGPRTAKAFAAAGLLEDPRDPTGPRYGGFTRSTSDRDFRTPGSGASRERRSPVSGGFPSMDGERDKEPFRYSLTTNGRSGDREYRSSGIRSGAASPSTVGPARPLSRGDSWSHSRPGPLFARTMSDLMSHRGSADGRDSVNGVHRGTGSAYSGGGGTGGGSTGSGGGRASPTTTSSLLAAQSQIQTLKDKHDAQTEALLAALADSQRTSRELREENDALKDKVRSLEERLVETIANSRQKEKELSRAMRARPFYSPDRTRTVVSHRDAEFPHHGHSRQPPPKPPARSTPSPTKRRLSTSSSVFPAIPGSMSLLMAETPGSPPQGSESLRSSSSPPPSPTLVLPRLASKQKVPERQETNGHNAIPLPAPQSIPMSHKRSTSGASVATSANFSFESGSPGSLKLKPEHELLLGDMTRLSLVTGFGGDSETEN